MFIEIVVGFVDIGGIVHHQCFDFLFIRYVIEYKIQNKKPSKPKILYIKRFSQYK
jgi:hypothetical protein